MREFARILLTNEGTKLVAQRLQTLLHSEIAIKKTTSVQEQHRQSEIHPNLLAQPDFVYLSAAEKLGKIEHYQNLRQELNKTRDLIDLISNADSTTRTNMTSSFQELFSLLKQVDSISELSPATLPVFEKLQKTSFVLNERVRMMVKESYGFEGIMFDNIEQLFNSHITQITSIHETIDYLVQRGMSFTLA